MDIRRRDGERDGERDRPAFRLLDSLEDKAVKAVAALANRDEETFAAFTKRDVEVAVIKADLSVLKWMAGFTLTFIVMTFGKMFIH